MKKAGRPVMGKTNKARTTLTLDPDLLAAVKKLFGARANMSAFFEQAGWLYFKSLSKRHPGDIATSKRVGK